MSQWKVLSDLSPRKTKDAKFVFVIHVCESESHPIGWLKLQCESLRCENIADLVETRSLRTLWMLLSYLSLVLSSDNLNIFLSRDSEAESVFSVHVNTVNCWQQVAARTGCTPRLVYKPVDRVPSAPCFVDLIWLLAWSE